MKLCRYILFFAAVFFVNACSNTKYLSQDQELYAGATVKIKSSSKISNGQKNELKSQLTDLLRPKPNSKILGIRFKLFVYNHVKPPKKNKGFKYWLKYKVGEPPVIASMNVLNKNSAVLQNRLENRGYFHDTVMLDTTSKDKKLTVHYTAYIDSQYKIRKVIFPQGNDSLSVSIRKFTKNTFLKPGAPYDLDAIKNERSRIDARLKIHGFFYFSPDDLLINVDSTVGNHQVDMTMQVKPETAADARKAYRISQIFVFADYNIKTDRSLAKANVENFGGYKIIDSAHKFRPVIFSRTLVAKPGDVYDEDKRNLALNRLVTLGVFKFVKARYEKADTDTGNYLNTFYYLTPARKKSIRLQATALTKSDNSAGGQLSLNFLNKNTFKGAELFKASATVGLQQQFSSEQNNTTKQFGLDFNLSVPRIISPFNLNTKSGFVPKTNFDLNYQLFQSDTLYTLNSFNGSYSYSWKNNFQSQNDLNLIAISYVSSTRIAPAFQKELDTNITLARSIEPQLIVGSNYNYNINTQARANNKKNNFYFNANADASGNLISLLGGGNINKGKVISFFNIPLSEYIKGEVDLRHYYKITKTTILASRIDAGMAYAFGNSSAVPFIKEFFAGGTNDIRAFRSRSLGPGSYYAGNPDSAFLPEQPGDIKLELNTELRAKLFSIVNGAIFADAGNVWTARYDSTRPGSQFSSKFLSQTAVGIGAGLRFDLSILVLRLDVAFPLRKPWLAEGSRWVINQIDFGNSEWRSQNLVFNLAIGYPF
jgi:outer membrane protein assembly factor BamA